MEIMTNAVFAYGTLKRGFCRAKCWPRDPTQVEVGFVRGQLLDLDEYPGLLPGNDWIRGEIWSFNPDDMPTTLAVLDAVEGYRQAGESDWYVRQTLNVFDRPDGEFIGAAETYLIAAPRLIARGRAILPADSENGISFAEWSRRDD